MQQTRENGIPCVHVGKNRISRCDTLCYIDFEEGAYRLTRHLLSLGQKQICLLLDPAENHQNAQIEAGFFSAARESGRRIETGKTFCESGVQSGYSPHSG